jgi:hypothetical protein
MTHIVSYQKQSDAYTVYQLNAPEESTELCTIDGVTYVSVPDDDLPEQAAQISASIVNPVTLTTELREAIKAASPHCALIHERMEAKIRDKYSLSDEQYFSRISSGAALGLYTFEAGESVALQAFGAYVESVRQWGREQRALLGL